MMRAMHTAPEGWRLFVVEGVVNFEGLMVVEQLLFLVLRMGSISLHSEDYNM
jgi:hypothetical protein